MILKENGLAVDYTVLGTETVTEPSLLYLDDLGEVTGDVTADLIPMSPDGFTPVGTNSSGDFFGDILNIGGNLIKDWLGNLDLDNIFGGGGNGGYTPVPDVPSENQGTDVTNILANPIVITGLIIGTVLLIKK